MEILDDIIAGELAIPVAFLAAHAASRFDGAIAAWNLFGALDLVAAVFLGVAPAAARCS